MEIKAISAMIITVSVINCHWQTSFFYNLDKPDRKIELPAILNEVSGLTDIDSAHVACLQDELGIVFIYNFSSNTIVAQHKKPRPFNFRPASLAVHPGTGKIYIISASDRMLIVMTRDSRIEDIQRLDSEIFTKAEGITFLNNGTMIITNEGSGKAPTLLVYGMRP